MVRSLHHLNSAAAFMCAPPASFQLVPHSKGSFTPRPCWKLHPSPALPWSTQPLPRAVARGRRYWASAAWRAPAGPPGLQLRCTVAAARPASAPSGQQCPSSSRHSAVPCVPAATLLSRGKGCALRGWGQGVGWGQAPPGAQQVCAQPPLLQRGKEDHLLGQIVLAAPAQLPRWRPSRAHLRAPAAARPLPLPLPRARSRRRCCSRRRRRRPLPLRPPAPPPAPRAPRAARRRCAWWQ